MAKSKTTAVIPKSPKVYEEKMEKSKEVRNEKTETTISLSLVQEMMKIQQNTMLACFNSVVENLSKKVDGILCDVQDLKASLNFMSKDYEGKFEYITNNVDVLKKEMNNTKILNAADHNLVKEHAEKLVDIEDRSRRNNLRVDGLPEHDRETWEITEQKVKDLFRDKLGINDHIEIDRAHRVGRSEPNKSRTIVLRCNNFKQKEKIKKASTRLRGTGIYI